MSARQLADAKAPIDDTKDPNGLGDPGDPDRSSGRVGPGRKLPAVPRSAMVNKRPTAIGVGEVDAVGFRGEMIIVRGALTSNEEGVKGQRIDIYLAPANRGGDDAILVGHAVSTDDGSFVANVELPQDIELREYEVFAATPGDAKYAPAVSN